MIVWCVATYVEFSFEGNAKRRSTPHTRASIEIAPTLDAAIAKSKGDVYLRRVIFSDDSADPYRVIKKPTFKPGILDSCTVAAKEVREALPTDKGEFVFRYMVRYTEEVDLGNLAIEKGNTRPAVVSAVANSLAEAEIAIMKKYRETFAETLDVTEIVKTERYIVVDHEV